MTRTAADVVTATILLALAAVATRLLVTRDYLTYVRPVMAPFLGLSVAFLLFLAGWTLRNALRGPPRGHPAHLPTVAWLLLLPVVIIGVIAPQSLGAFTAARSSGTTPPPPVDTGGYLPLPVGNPLGVPLDVYAERAAYGGGATLAGRRFSMVGFVGPGPGDTWYLTRLQIRCCAADALPLRVLAVGANPQTAGIWVQATGSYLPVGADQTARLQVETVESVLKPAVPYVYG